jgi:hypothetical protein
MTATPSAGTHPGNVASPQELRGRRHYVSE